MRTFWTVAIFLLILGMWAAFFRWLIYETPESTAMALVGAIFGGFTVAWCAIRWPASFSSLEELRRLVRRLEEDEQDPRSR